MTKEKEVPFIYFEARPKRGNAKIVDQKILDMMGLFAEIYDKHRRNCNLRPTRKLNNMWTVQMTFESEEARSLLTEDTRFDEIMTDLRAYCKPAHKIKRLFYTILHPGKQFGGIILGPVSFPD